MRVDPDVMVALRQLAATGDTAINAKLQAKHDRQTQNALETQITLLEDEVEKVIPRSHPLFESLLLLSAINKVVKLQQEPEFTSYLDEGLPHRDW